MRIALTPRYLLAFAALTILCGLGHEFVHHIAGAMVCGDFGTKTFNSFHLAAQCANRPLAFVLSTWAGPIFTFGLMWLGWQRLHSADAGMRQLGFALIFANFPVNRLLFALLGWNDEQFVTRTVIGDGSLGFWLTNLAIWVMALPPLFAAWRALARERRVAWFAGFFLLPFVFVMIFGVVMEDWLLLKQRVLADSFFGIPLLLVLTEVVCLAVYLAFRADLAGDPRRLHTASLPTG